MLKSSDKIAIWMEASVDDDFGKMGISALRYLNNEISYWATWCAPCIKEMPSMKRAEEILEDYGYTFLLVSDETIDKISNFKNEMNFDLKFLKSNKSFESLGVYAMPTSYIFDENGKIVETIVGVVEWDSEEIINIYFKADLCLYLLMNHVGFQRMQQATMNMQMELILN